MKKSTFVLCAILCAGLVQSSRAQPATPTTYETALAAGKNEFKTAKYELATKSAAESLAVAASPDETGEALRLLGESYYRRKMYIEAEAQWAKILALPDGEDGSAHFFAHLGYARSYSAQRQWDKAIPEYQIVIKSFKGQMADKSAAETQQTLAPFSFALANAHAGAKQYDLAQGQLKSIIEYSEGDSGLLLLALVKRGEVAINQRDFKGALDSFNQALGMTGKSEFSDEGEMKKLIPMLESLVKAEVGAGQVNDGKLKIIVVPPAKIAKVLNEVAQSLLDAVMTGFLTEPDEE